MILQLKHIKKSFPRRTTGEMHEVLKDISIDVEAGEIVSIIAHTADTIGDKIHIEDEIRTMTAAKRFEQKIMNAIPIGIVLYIEFTSPGFFDSMYASIGGRAIMTACMAVYIAAIYLSGKILDIEI